MGYQAVGEFTNHYSIDSVAFGLPLLYSKQLPDFMQVRDKSRHKTTGMTTDNDAISNFAPNRMGLAQPRTHIPTDSIDSIQ